MTPEFRLLKTTFIQEYKMNLLEYCHIKTGAKIYDLQNDDQELTFAISFSTPSNSGTGVAHIVEHTVFCETKNYPVKDIFFSYISTNSIATYFNALTFSDKTLYPFSTASGADYLILMQAYLDVCFNPILDEKKFAQEGWRYEIDPETGKLKFNGIVYNEMKGVYSSSDYVAYNYLDQAVYGNDLNSPYCKNSGGQVELIPSLTFEQYKSFYYEHYKPEKAQIFFYGNSHLNPKDAILKFNLVNSFLNK